MKGLSTEVFLLMLVLVIVAYNVGSSNVLRSGAASISGVANTLTGRNAAGNFAAYPA